MLRSSVSASQVTLLPASQSVSQHRNITRLDGGGVGGEEKAINLRQGHSN